MVDLDEIEHDASWLVRNGYADSCVTQADEVLELITRLRQAEKAAARYKEIITDCRGMFVIAGDVEMVSAIDEAMK